VGGYFCGTLECGRMADNWEFFGELLGVRACMPVSG